MQAILDANLTVVDAGPWRAQAERLATFRRKGRLPPKTGRWVRLYHRTATGVTVPVGLWKPLRQRWGRPLPVRDRRFQTARVAFGWRGHLYSYQTAAVRAVLDEGGGIVVALPGSGKTVCGLACVAAWGQPTLWLVHTKDLAEQARQRAGEVLSLQPWQIGLVGMGEDDTLSPRVVLWIGLMQTLARRAALVRRLATRVGTVVVDEAHHCPSESLRRILVRLPARYKLGLSGTPDRTDGLGPMMRALLGPLIRVPLTTLLASGRIVLPTVYRVPTRFRHVGPDRSWAALDRARAHDGGRLRQTVSLLARLHRGGRRVLCLVNRIDHAQALARAGQAAHVPVIAVTGVVPLGARQRLYREVEAGRAVLVATRLADEGLDIPRLDTLVLAAAGRSDVRLQQQVGRIMRTAPGKPDAWVVDLVDGGVPVLAYHARLRRWVYARWELPVREGRHD